jgi:serine/threonine protein kinase
MEYVKGGELFKAISELGGAGIKETEARDILQQLLSAVLHLHSIGIVHRDLKLENILVCDDNENALDDNAVRIKLVDFGLGRTYREGQLLETRCGSEEYAAPEIIRGQPYDGRLADAWSFGVIMYACLNGHLPFNPDGNGNLATKIVSGCFSIDETAVSQAAVQIIRGLLTVDPARRTTLQSLQQHHYFL